MSITKITLQPDTIEKLMDRTWDDSAPEVKGFEGWELESDTDNGSFDSEKGAMYDYKLTLTNPQGEVFVGRGGYYTGPTGEVFNYEVEFTPKKKKTTKEEQEYKLYLKLKEKYEDE